MFPIIALFLAIPSSGRSRTQHAAQIETLSRSIVANVLAAVNRKKVLTWNRGWCFFVLNRWCDCDINWGGPNFTVQRQPKQMRICGCRLKASQNG